MLIYRKCAALAAGLALVAPGAQAFAQAAAPAPNPAEGAWLSSIKIRVADLQKSLDFYVGQLGLKQGQRYGEDELALEWPGGGSVLVLVHGLPGKPVEGPRGAAALIVIVPDAVALGAKLTAAGYKGVRPPIVTPSMTIVFAEDPDGDVVELITLTKPA